MDFCSKKTVPRVEHEPEEERWIWLSFNPTHRLIIAVYAGPMTQESADIIVQKTGERINEEKLPVFVTDGRKFYAEALLKRYGYKKEFKPTGKRRRPRKALKIYDFGAQNKVFASSANAQSRIEICSSQKEPRRRKSD